MKEKVVSINTLAGEFKSSKELKDYCNKQYETLLTARERIKELENEVDQLKSLLCSTTELIPNSKIMFRGPSEQEICEIQIELIKKRGMDRELTFEDTKKIETLVRTLKIIKEKPIKDIPNKLNDNITDAELVSLAASPKKDE